jgi:hypothetical protein
VVTSITNHPTAYVGGTITFAPVTAKGTRPFSYQWYRSGVQITDDGVKYSGSTTASLSISNLSSPGDSGSYYAVISNPSSSYASNVADVLTVNYRLASINSGQPQSVTTFVGTPTSITAGQSGATAPVTSQWYKGTTLLPEGSEYSGTQTPTLTIAATTTADTGNNYFIVYTNPGGSVTSAVATVTVMTPPAHSSVSYSNQFYTQTFDSLPDPGTAGVIANGTASASGVSVNSINNPLNPGSINGVAYSLANPFDFAYPVILSSYIGGLNLGSTMSGWYGAADTNTADAGNPDGITRFGAQNGDQSTGGVIDFGLNDVNGGVAGTNRALGLLSTSTTGSTAFGLKLINTSGTTLNFINVGFMGELWRNNKAARTLSFSYAIDNTANSFVLMSQPTAPLGDPTPQDIPGTITVPDLTFSFPTNDGSVLAMDGNQPSNQSYKSVSNFALSSPWQPGAALWLIWSVNYYGQGTGQGYGIDNLAFSASAALITRPSLGVVSYSGGASGTGFKLAFTNSPAVAPQFTVWASTNIALPLSQWLNLGHPSESSSGHYQFTDAQATNKPVRFYRITRP